MENDMNQSQERQSIGAQLPGERAIGCTTMGHSNRSEKE
jgi:hypothetical protein